MDKKFTAEELLDAIQNKMEVEERWKLLLKLHELYYDKGIVVEEEY